MPRMCDSPTRFAFSQRLLESVGPLEADSLCTQRELCDSLCTGLRLMVGKTTPPRKSWLFRYRHRGRKRAIGLGEFPAVSLKVARERVLEMKSRLAHGEDPADQLELRKAIPGFTTFARRDYLPHAKNTKRSWKDDQCRLETGAIPLFKERPIDTITTRDMQQFHAAMKAKNSPSTANRHLTLLQRMFTLAVEWNLLEKNPCKGVKKFQESQGAEHFLSEDEVKRFLAALDHSENPVMASALRMLLFTGLRKREVLDLLWSDVDRNAGNIVLRFTKSGRVRTVPLSSAALREIEAMWERREGKHPYVWPGQGCNAPIINPQKCFNAALRRAKIKGCRIHDLRHTYASTLVNAGATLFEVQKALGHASSQMTQRYSHLTDSTLRDRAEMAGQRLTGVQG
jgi:integrase